MSLMPPDFDLEHVTYRIQYIPAFEVPQIDQPNKPPAPTGLSATPGERINTIRVTPGALLPNDVVEVFASIDNDRTNAVRFAWGTITEFTHDLPSAGVRWYWTRIRRELEGLDVFSDWYPVSATGGVEATALDFVGELPGSTGVFLDTMEHQDYARFYTLDDGTPTITYPADGENGGRVLQAVGKAQLQWKQNIPYDPDSLYLVTVKARMTVAPSDASKDNFYAGVVAYAADGTTKIQTSGASSGGVEHYAAANNFDFGGVTLGTWTTFRGYLSGHSGSPSPAPAPAIGNPMELYTASRFFRPTFVLNVEGGNGTMQIDYIRIDRVKKTEDLAPGAATAVYSGYDAGPDTYTVVTEPTGPDFYLRVDGEPIGDGEVIRVLMTTQTKVNVGGAIAQTWVNMDYTGNPGNHLSGPIHDVYDTTYQSVTTVLESTSSFPPIGVDWWVTVQVSTSNNASWQQTSLKVELIRR